MVIQPFAGVPIPNGWAAVDLSTLHWRKGADSNPGLFTTADLVGAIDTPVDSNHSSQAFCSAYRSESYSISFTRHEDMTFCIIFSSSTSAGQVWLCNQSVANVNELVQSLRGTILFYKKHSSS